jgi:hypothetical protein
MNVRWKGVSGRFYDAEAYQLENPLPISSGVYIVCSYLGPNQYHSIYVGECDDFNDRLYVNLKNHHCYRCFIREAATDVCILAISDDRQLRLDAETDLRNGLNPVCNQQ